MNINKNLDKETIKQYLRNNFERIFKEYKENQENKEMYFFSKGRRIRTAYIADGTYTILGSFLDNDYTKQNIDCDKYKDIFYSYVEKEIEEYYSRNFDLKDIELDLSNLSQKKMNKIAVQLIYKAKGNKFFEDCIDYFDYDMEEFDFDSKEEDFCIKYLLDKKVTYQNIDKEIVDLFLHNFKWNLLTLTDEVEFSEVFDFEHDEKIEFIEYEIKEDNLLVLTIKSNN